MKKLSDYKGDEAIELWADLLEPLTTIMSDPETEKLYKSKATRATIAKEVIKNHRDEAKEILLRIDDTPLDGLNFVLRIVALLADIGEHEEIKSFFDSAAEEQTASESSGSLMESTEVEEN